MRNPHESRTWQIYHPRSIDGGVGYVQFLGHDRTKLVAADDVFAVVDDHDDGSALLLVLLVVKMKTEIVKTSILAGTLVDDD